MYLCLNTFLYNVNELSKLTNTTICVYAILLGSMYQDCLRPITIVTDIMLSSN